MAALIDAARGVRAEAQRERARALGLRLSCREAVGVSQARLARADAMRRRIQARRAEPQASPWSTLEWLPDDETLAGVLVLVP